VEKILRFRGPVLARVNEKFTKKGFEQADKGKQSLKMLTDKFEEFDFLMAI